uniref:Uncharacterized protein n=1 Tax=Romanomermis culicivorax TaxID=13658 RepID=A0A915KTG9_ROMCU
MSIVSKISRTYLKLLDDSIRLRLIADKALDTEVVSDIDSNRAKTPGGDLDDEGNKSIASDECAFPLIVILNGIEKGNGDLSYIQKAVRHSLRHFSLMLHNVMVDRHLEILRILGINTKILPEILSVDVASDENVQQCLDLSTKIDPPPLFGHLPCSKHKERGPKDKTLAVALQNLGGPSN